MKPPKWKPRPRIENENPEKAAPDKSSNIEHMFAHTEKFADGRELSPVEILRMMVQEIEAGKINQDQLLVIALTTDEEGLTDRDARACNMDFRDLVFHLEFIKHDLLDELNM